MVAGLGLSGMLLLQEGAELTVRKLATRSSALLCPCISSGLLIWQALSEPLDLNSFGDLLQILSFEVISSVYLLSIIFKIIVSNHP